MDQQLAPGQGGCAREVRPDLGPLVAVAVALGTLVLEDQLA
jgi:hypothetical protein